MYKKYFSLNTLSTILLYISILAFTISFNFSDNRSGGWQQQFLPNLNGASIADFCFTDSLVGFAVTNVGNSNSYILKTTNGGDNWEVKLSNNRVFKRVEFINENTGFANAFTTIYKTTDAGEVWNGISLPGIYGDDMFVLNNDTIWLTMNEGLTGGVYKTTNGGASWIRQLNLGTLNPENIYMYNKDIGFISKVNTGSPYTRKTTDSGKSWFVVVNNEGFTDMSFVDSLTGWKNNGTATIIQKTINGGLNWSNQEIPKEGGPIFLSRINSFVNVNTDTIFGVGGQYQYSFGVLRGLIYRTTNGGVNWGYQLVDSNIHISRYLYIDFVNKLNGWAYTTVQTGIHSKTGGDSITYYTKINLVSNNIPIGYNLSQNYPNPFNPKTKIKFEMSKKGNAIVNVHDLRGKLVETIVKNFLTSGEYETEFDGNNYPSGIYFYSLLVDGQLIDCKKMTLIK